MDRQIEQNTPFDQLISQLETLGISSKVLGQEQDKLQLKIPFESKNMIYAMIDFINRIPRANFLFEKKAESFYLTMKTPVIDLDSFVEKIKDYNPNHDYWNELSIDMKEIMTLFEQANLQNANLQIGVKIGEQEKEYRIHSDDLQMIRALQALGIPETDQLFHFVSNHPEEAAAILKGGELKGTELSQEAREVLGIHENKEAAELTKENSLVTTYRKEIPGLDGAYAWIHIITPFEKVGNSDIEVPTSDRFIELALEFNENGKKQINSTRFHYQNGVIFDRDILPQIADEYRLASKMEGNHIEQSTENPSSYIITDENGKQSEYLDADNQIRSTEAIGNFIHETDFGKKEGVQKQEKEQKFDKENEKVLVKVNQVQTTGSVADTTAGKASSIILGIMIVVVIVLLIVIFAMLM